MNDNLMEKVTALGERLKISGTEVGKKMSAGVSSMSFKMREFFQGPNQADMIVEEATAESLDGPEWATNLEICEMVNQERINSAELIRAVKKRIMMQSNRIQYFALVLLETVASNCDKAFSEIAAERVLDEMVKLIDDPQTVVNNRNKALLLIKAWGESSDDLRYLPVYEETYKSLRLRGVRFPGRDESRVPIVTPPPAVSEAETNATFAEVVRASPPVQTFSPDQIKEAFDVARNSIELLSTVLSSSPQQEIVKDELTTVLVQQCRSSRSTIQIIIDAAGDNEAVLFEALNLNDEVQKILSEYKDLKKLSVTTQQEPEPAMIPVSVEPEEVGSRGFSSPRGGHDDSEMMDDLDEMIFGKKTGSTSEGGSEPAKKQQPTKGDDLISF